MSFVVHIQTPAIYRLVPEYSQDPGIPVPFQLDDTGDIQAFGRMVMELEDNGVATYLNGRLREISIADGWRLEQWPLGSSVSDELVRRFLDELPYLKNRTDSVDGWGGTDTFEERTQAPSFVSQVG